MWIEIAADLKTLLVDSKKKGKKEEKAERKKKMLNKVCQAFLTWIPTMPQKRGIL